MNIISYSTCVLHKSPDRNSPLLLLHYFPLLLLWQHRPPMSLRHQQALFRPKYIVSYKRNRYNDIVRRYLNSYDKNLAWLKTRKNVSEMFEQINLNILNLLRF